MKDTTAIIVAPFYDEKLTDTVTLGDVYASLIGIGLVGSTSDFHGVDGNSKMFNVIGCKVRLNLPQVLAWMVPKDLLPCTARLREAQ